MTNAFDTNLQTFDTELDAMLATYNAAYMARKRALKALQNDNTPENLAAFKDASARLAALRVTVYNVNPRNGDTGRHIDFSGATIEGALQAMANALTASGYPKHRQDLVRGVDYEIA
jgi:hypothetical protein